MNWETIDSTEELQALDYSICWSDGEILEAYKVDGDQSYFPDDISRSGYDLKNLHLLIDSGFGIDKLLEIVLIHTTASTISDFSGHVSVLKIVHLGVGVDNASRIIYRWIERDDYKGAGYFARNWET
jgi:hypothetical protein